MNEIAEYKEGYIFKIIEDNNLEEVRKVLEEHPEVIDERDDFYWYTPLMYALINGRTDICNILIEKEKSLIEEGKPEIYNLYGCNALDRYGYDALAYAIKYEAGDEIVDEILSMQKRKNDKALLVAAELNETDMVKKLVRAGHNCNSSDKQCSVLMYAARNNNTELIDFLVEAGAEINFISKVNTTALTIAAVNNNTEAVESLINNGANIDLVIDNGLTKFNVIKKLEIFNKFPETDRQYTDMIDFIKTKQLELMNRDFPNQQENQQGL